MRSEFVGLVCWAGMLFAVNSAATTKLVPLKCIILYAPLDWIMLQRTPPLDLIKWLQLPLISKACLLTPLEVSLSRISCWSTEKLGIGLIQKNSKPSSDRKYTVETFNYAVELIIRDIKEVWLVALVEFEEGFVEFDEELPGKVCNCRAIRLLISFLAIDSIWFASWLNLVSRSIWCFCYSRLIASIFCESPKVILFWGSWVLIVA